MIKIAIDVMGGDNAPIEIIRGCNIALTNKNDLYLNLYGDSEIIKSYLDIKFKDRVSIIHCPKKVDMGEKDPIAEVRNNRDTSLVTSFMSVKNNECMGVVSAGPTQVVVACSHLVIRRIKGMKRTALCPMLPAMGYKNRLLLDVGANVELRSEHLVQLAQYATIYLQETKNIKNPLVGLVNIGSEPGKGREVDVETYYLLKDNQDINFYGNIEPKEMFKSECDILITDGFTGNMIMKTSEGVASAIGNYLKCEIKKSLRSKIGYLFMKKVFKSFKQEMNPDEIGGAMLFGINGVVIKAHGSSNDYAFSCAIKQAYNTIKANVIEKMKEKIQDEEE